MAKIAPLVWVNGFPGSGKMTVATVLQALHGSAILLDNHKLIDPVEARYPRDHPEYQTQRRLFRQQMFDQYAGSKKMLSQLVIFTDFQSDNELGRRVATEYRDAAQKAGREFKPIYLTCDPDENARRIVGPDRVNSGTRKLTDAQVLKDFYLRYKLFEFTDYRGFAINTTHISPHQAAATMLEFICKDTERRP